MKHLLILSGISLLFATAAAAAQPFEKMECSKLLKGHNESVAILNQLSREAYESGKSEPVLQKRFEFHSKRMTQMSLELSAYGHCEKHSSGKAKYQDYAELQREKQYDLCQAAIERGDEEYYVKNSCN